MPEQGERAPKNWARRAIVLVVGCVVFGLILAEVSARLLGIGSFPLYESSNTVGYIPAASQKGAFLNKYKWVFNERHMGIDQKFAPAPSDILLIGDSIVYGGNRIDQPDKLGPRLAERTGCRVWPISAGSWALLNELAVLKENPDFLKVGKIVFVSNMGDFAEASVWKDPYSHPRSHPLSVAYFAVHKYYFPDPGSILVENNPRAEAEWKNDLANFLSGYKGSVFFALYPGMADIRHEPRPWPKEISVSHGTLKSISIENDARWGPKYYRDDRTHPNAAGNIALADIIGDTVGSCGVVKPT